MSRTFHQRCAQAPEPPRQRSRFLGQLLLFAVAVTVAACSDDESPASGDAGLDANMSDAELDARIDDAASDAVLEQDIARDADVLDDPDGEIDAPELPPACGDGRVDDGERCDDANIEPGDGCAPDCQIELGWRCGDVPSACVEICEGAPVGATCGRAHCVSYACNSRRECEAAELPCSEREPACRTGSCVDDVCVFEALPDGWSDACEQPGGECRFGGCLDGRCAMLSVPDETETSDGSICVLGRAQSPTSCLSRRNGVPCAGPTPCTAGQCVEQRCEDVPANEFSPCDTGIPDEAGVCRSGMCHWPVTCGNGVLDVGEECDDGNVGTGDGCDEACEIEPGWDCDGAGATCSNRCEGQPDGASCGREDCVDWTCRDGRCRVPYVRDPCGRATEACQEPRCVDNACVSVGLDGFPDTRCRSQAGTCELSTCTEGVCEILPQTGEPDSACASRAGTCELAACVDGVCDVRPSDGPADAECASRAGPCEEASCVDGRCELAALTGPADAACAATAGWCDTPSCEDGSCVRTQVSDGTVGPLGACIDGRPQPFGDCSRLTDGTACMPGNACFVGTCEAGACLVERLPVGTSCVAPDGGEGICDASGICTWTPGCGNGRRDVGEECDLGADNGVGLGCTDSCMTETCVACSVDGTRCAACAEIEPGCRQRSNDCAPTYWDDWDCSCGFGAPVEPFCRDTLPCGEVVCDAEGCAFEAGPDGEPCVDGCLDGVCASGDCLPRSLRPEGSTCDTLEPQECTVALCVNGSCERLPSEDGGPCTAYDGSLGHCVAGACQSARSCEAREDGAPCGDPGPCAGACIDGQCTSRDGSACTAPGDQPGACVAGRCYALAHQPCDGGFLINGVCERNRRAVETEWEDWNADLSLSNDGEAHASCGAFDDDESEIAWTELVTELPEGMYRLRVSATSSENTGYFAPTVFEIWDECTPYGGRPSASGSVSVHTDGAFAVSSEPGIIERSFSGGAHVSVDAEADCFADVHGFETWAHASASATVRSVLECGLPTCQAAVVTAEGCEPVRQEPGDALCGETCVNLLSSRNHCGACDVACPPTQVCTRGVCSYPEGGSRGCDPWIDGVVCDSAVPPASSRCPTDIDGRPCAGGPCDEATGRCLCPDNRGGPLCTIYTCAAPGDEVDPWYGYRCGEDW